MIELMTVLAIIVILVTILIPVISKVRRSSQAASTGSQIAALSAAIQRYQQDFSAYPGPLPDAAIGHGLTTTLSTGGPTIQNVTGPENLVLSLLGGLTFGPPSPPSPPPIVFDWRLVGKGAQKLQGGPPKRYEPYLDATNLSWNDDQPAGGANGPSATSGIYADDASGNRTTSPQDSPIPEFVDNFPDPLPILYLRASVGAPGVIGPPPVTPAQQYNILHIYGYTGTFASQSIGVGKTIKAGEYKGPITPAAGLLPHGLQTVDSTKSMDKASTNYQYPYDAYPYFSNKGIGGSPRQKDTYILISAGPDRVYGTNDDITSFGSVTE